MKGDERAIATSEGDKLEITRREASQYVDQYRQSSFDVL